ncbi:Nitric oxide reductase activation protein NorD [hydrothermal vent metagenome]|uniref:Nitric oxide reductase activation protein NorD n=1 Tax=hydrothermal vent metagenome TaxID=652676 RepID=A0A1W1CXQ6_9ZZZZ
MLKYFLEFEESIGRNWDKYLHKKVHKVYESERIYFADISKSLRLFYHLLGGDKAKELHVTDKRYVETSRSFLEKISFLGKDFYLVWQDEKAVYLPKSFAYFPKKSQNEMLYYWLIAMLTQVNITAFNIKEENTKASLYLREKYLGLKLFYEEVQEYIAFDEENSHNPLWVYADMLLAKSQKNMSDDEEEVQNREKDEEKIETLDMKKQSNSLDDSKESDGFLAFLPESLLSIMEQVNVDRCEDDSFDDNALYHAEDLDEITLGKKEANLSARVKLDLDLQADMTEIYPLGKGHLIDEWDYRKSAYLINYVRIKPQITLFVEALPLPKRLKRTVKKIQGELDLLLLDRVKNKRLPYGDRLNLDTWIEYKSAVNKSLHHQNFYTSYEKKTRDISTLILADVSLSTEGGISQDVRIIDVMKDGLMVFSEALKKLNDAFAIYSFSSLQNKKVYFGIIKNFKEAYTDEVRGHIDAMKPFYYTRLGAGIRESAKILEKQKTKNKLLLIISDGKPNDEDRYDGRYGIEDTKKAIEEVRKKGMIPFCITIDVDGQDYLPLLFGRNGYTLLRDAKKLPEILPKIYMNLTKE